MKKYCILLAICALHASLCAATNSALTDDQLSRIQFDQKIGAQVSPGLTFKDETGKVVHLGDYFGDKPTVLILGYYGCPMLCTLVLNSTAECFRNMTWKAGRQFNLVFVSINPDESSTLAAEKKTSYVHSYGRDCAGDWHFLTGGQNAITNLAASVGFQYAYDASIKQYAHPSGLIILTANGKVSHYLFGINFAAREVDDALREASDGKTGATESQFTLLCFHYAPIHGKYGNLILEIIRGAGILTVLALVGLLLISPRPGKAEKPK